MGVVEPSSSMMHEKNTTTITTTKPSTPAATEIISTLNISTTFYAAAAGTVAPIATVGTTVTMHNNNSFTIYRGDSGAYSTHSGRSKEAHSKRKNR